MNNNLNKQEIYKSSFNHTLLSDPNGYPEVEDVKFQGETIPYDESWLVSDNPDIARFAQMGVDDANNALENMAEVHRFNNGIAK